MLRFKHFSGRGGEIEESINAWLTEFEPDVTQMAQTLLPDGLTSISFLFEESFRGQELRLSAEHGMRRAAVPVLSAADARDKPVHVDSDPPRVSSDDLS